MTALVRGVSAALTVSGVTQIVSGSTSQKTGVRAGRRDRLGRRVEGERRDDDLVAGADAERAQGDRDGLGAVGDADRVRGAQVGANSCSKAATSGPRMNCPRSRTSSIAAWMRRRSGVSGVLGSNSETATAAAYAGPSFGVVWVRAPRGWSVYPGPSCSPWYSSSPRSPTSWRRSPPTWSATSACPGSSC